MIDKERMVNQEEKDFKITERIMKNIFKAHNKDAELKQNPIYSAVDATMLVDKKYKYNIEIKERVQNLDIYDTLPLKVTKYCNIMENTDEDTKPLIIYLLNNEEYYLFNLKELDWNKIKCKNWEIKKVEYTSNQQKEKQPTYFIPISQCIYNGLIPKDDANN